MKLLIITHAFMPDGNARALRWSRIAREWQEAGHEVVVVTRRPPGRPARELTDGIEIHRAGGSLIEALRQKVRPSSVIPSGAPALSGRQALKGALGALYRATWRRIYWPDQAAPWIGPAKRAATRLVEAGGFDAMVSVSHPFSSHVVGLALKRRFPTLPWLTDSGDPFSFFEEIPLNNVALYGARNQRVEAAVLDAADIAAVTVESCRAAYQVAFPANARKQIVIGPLVTLAAARSSLASAPDPYRLVYVGTLYRRIRNPSFLLHLLAALPRATLDFYGDANDCADQFENLPPLVMERVRRHGVVPGAIAAQAMAQAGTLVNIGNATRHQLPSKVFEYVATGRPILNLVGGDWDSALPLLSRYPSIHTLVTSNAGPSGSDIAALMDWMGSITPAGSAAVDELLAEHRPAVIAKAYIDAIARLA